MADISSESKQTTGTRKPEKKSTRVDLTPMVDLGFLLITFFIFTTTMSQPTAMKLVMPKDVDDEDRMLTKQSATLTLLLATDHTVYYYEGGLNQTASNLKVASLQTLRDVIMDKKKRTDASDLFIIVKAAKSSVYKSVVDVLDEMTINDVKRYALVDITPAEEQLLNVSENKERNLK
jgi:biopolymer transport protein ExbD